MAVAANVITNQQKGGKILLRFVANGYVNCVANSTVNSDIGAPGNDQIQGATISKLAWSTTANIKIARGSNTILTLCGSDHWDLRQMGMLLNESPAANLVVTITDGNSSLLVELNKEYAGSAPPDADGH